MRIVNNSLAKLNLALLGAYCTLMTSPVLAATSQGKLPIKGVFDNIVTEVQSVATPLVGLGALGLAGGVMLGESQGIVKKALPWAGGSALLVGGVGWVTDLLGSGALI